MLIEGKNRIIFFILIFSYCSGSLSKQYPGLGRKVEAKLPMTLSFFWFG